MILYQKPMQVILTIFPKMQSYIIFQSHETVKKIKMRQRIETNKQTNSKQRERKAQMTAIECCQKRPLQNYLKLTDNLQQINSNNIS